MTTLHSISPISKKYPTQGSRPVLVLASDIEEYVVKYPFYPGDFRLVNEYLGTRFAEIWGIRMPSMAWITVDRAHIPETFLGNQLSYSSFDKVVIGHRFVSHTIDVNVFSAQIDAGSVKKYDRDAFLRIALFDLWLANDDRNANNINLLLDASDQAFIPIAIDHEKIFNTGDLSLPVYQLNYHDSLLYSALYHRFLTNSRQTADLVNEIGASLYHHVSACQTHLADILSEIPDTWGIDITALENRLHHNIFTKQWVDETEQNFRELASLSMRGST